MLLLVSASSSVTAVVTSCSFASLSPAPQITLVSLSLVSRPSTSSFVVAVGVEVKSENGFRTLVQTVEVMLPEKGPGMNILLGTLPETARHFTAASKAATKTPMDKYISDLPDLINQGKALSSLEQLIDAQKAGGAFVMPEQQAKAILAEVFDSASTKKQGAELTGAYARDVVALLLRRRWLHDEMYPDGVLSALIRLKDWVSPRALRRCVYADG
jgi:hypothetical protein